MYSSTEISAMIAVFLGKCICEILSKEVFGVKVKNLEFGLQPHKIPDTETLSYTMPSSSAKWLSFLASRTKVHCYIKLKDFIDQLKGIERNTDVQEVQYTIDLQLAQEDAKKTAVKEEKYYPGYEAAYGGADSENPCNSEPCSILSNGLAADSVELRESSLRDIPDGQQIAQPLQIRFLPLTITVERESKMFKNAVSQLHLNAAVLMQLSRYRPSVC